MKAKKGLIILSTLAAIVLSAGTVFSDETKNEELGQYYEMVINLKIHQSLSKAALNDSRSAAIRDCAAKGADKAIFLSANKDLLIEQMLSRGIGKKMHKIEVFLNGAFHESKDRLAKK